jgi:hypothetical protein
MSTQTLFDWDGGSAAQRVRRASQASKIASWLIGGGSITPMEALDKWGCFRLAARIHELRRGGMNIVEEDVCADGTRYARYFMEARG